MFFASLHSYVGSGTEQNPNMQTEDSANHLRESAQDQQEIRLWQCASHQNDARACEDMSLVASRCLRRTCGS